MLRAHIALTLSALFALSLLGCGEPVAPAAPPSASPDEGPSAEAPQAQPEAPAAEGESASGASTPVGTPFTGTVTYSMTAEGDEAKLVAEFTASRLDLAFTPTHYRQQETGGLTPGILIVDRSASSAVRLFPAQREFARAGGVQDLDAVDPRVKALLTRQFETKLEATDETATICGYETRKHKVLSSGFVRGEGYVWITDAVTMPRCRFDVGFRDETRIISPLPVSIPLTRGMILKVAVTERGTTVTWLATEVDADALAPTFFDVPSDYTERVLDSK
ncbi:MAG: hypothetical protein O2894_00700 [Planctomycetota bacterium]|nr:hypothetical protein [Planctomycetota bacterium]